MTSRSPPRLRSAIPAVAFPAVADATGASMLSLLYQFERSEWWPAEMVRWQQFRQLEALLTHAIRYVPALQPGLAAAGYRPDGELTEDIWRRIPILTRRDVQTLGKNLHATRDPSGHGARHEFQSSGSTGTPIAGVQTERFLLFWHAMTLRDYLWQGLDLEARLGVIRYVHGATAKSDDTTLPAWTGAAGATFANGPAFVFDVNQKVSAQLDWVRRVDPDYLLAYPSGLKELLREAQRRGVRPGRLRAVKTFGEQLHDGLRDQLRTQWGVPLHDLYSAIETGYLALQCPENEHYHVMAESAVVEILDRADRPCAAGEVGRVVVTPLHNFAMPLVRYDIGDYAEAGPPCPCGRGLPVLRRILGRVRNMLILPDGGVRWPDVQQPISRAGLPVIQFQVVQRTRTALEVRLVVERALSAAEEDALRASLNEHCGAAFDVSFIYVSEVPRSRGGKYEDFYSEVAGRA